MSLEIYEGYKPSNEWENKILIYDSNTYLIPAYSKLLVKGIEIKA